MKDFFNRLTFNFDIFVICIYNITNTNISNTIYVSTTGDDNNSGLSPSSPVRSLPKAMEIASSIDSATNVEIRVAFGLYTNGDGLGSDINGVVISRGNITIVGGWDNSFDSVISKSELDGSSSLKHVIKIENVQNVTLKNSVIRGGKADSSTEPDGYGGGIYATNVSSLVIENVVLSNNVAQFGGGLFLNSLNNSTISGVISSNNAYYRAGGGIYLIGSTNNIFNVETIDNYANSYGGGLYIHSSVSNTISGVISNNTAATNGGGIFLAGGSSTNNNTIDATVISNSPNDIAP